MDVNDRAAIACTHCAKAKAKCDKKVSMDGPYISIICSVESFEGSPIICLRPSQPSLTFERIRCLVRDALARTYFASQGLLDALPTWHLVARIATVPRQEM